MKPALAVTLLLSAAASVARADVTLDVVGGTLFATSIEGTRAVVHVRAADKSEVAIETVSLGANPLPVQRISYSRAALAVHTGLGGSAPLTTALFKYGTAEGSYTATVLRDPLTGDITKPSSLRTTALDPTDPGAVLVDAGHVALPDGALRAWAVVRRSSGEALLVDFDVAGGAVRRTPLGFIAPIGSNKGSLVATPDGRAWVSVAGDRDVKLREIAIGSFAPLGQTRTLVVGEGIQPGSTRLGIIAILIGLFPQPTPAISYQAGDEVVVAALDGGSFRTVARQSIPPDASGLMADEGLATIFYLLPYIEQENIYRLAVGQEAELITTVGH